VVLTEKIGTRVRSAGKGSQRSSRGTGIQGQTHTPTRRSAAGFEKVVAAPHSPGEVIPEET
jgi:hypothetical protein